MKNGTYLNCYRNLSFYHITCTQPATFIMYLHFCKSFQCSLYKIFDFSGTTMETEPLQVGKKRPLPAVTDYDVCTICQENTTSEISSFGSLGYPNLLQHWNFEMMFPGASSEMQEVWTIFLIKI